MSWIYKYRNKLERGNTCNENIFLDLRCGIIIKIEEEGGVTAFESDKKIMNEVMKNLSEMSPEKIVEVTKTISLLDVVNQPNDFIKPLLNHAMVQAISD